MAMSRPASREDTEYPAEISDCPQLECGLPCLGAIILPCSHLTCRKCLRDSLQTKGQVYCTLCKEVIFDSTALAGSAMNFEKVVSKLGVDPVMHKMAFDQQRFLWEEDAPDCCLHTHAPTPASKLCLDCIEYYCHDCSQNHGRTEGHKLQHILSSSEMLHINNPSYSSTPEISSARSAQRRQTSGRQASARQTSGRQASARQTSGRQASARQTSGRQASARSFQVRHEDELKDLLREQLRHLHTAKHDYDSLKEQLQCIITKSKEVMDELTSRRNQIEKYIKKLPELAPNIILSEKEFPKGSFVWKTDLSEDGLDFVLNAASLRKRLEDVGQSSYSFRSSIMKEIKSRFNRLLHPEVLPHEDAPVGSTSRQLATITFKKFQKSKGVSITSLVSTPSGKVIMADKTHNAVMLYSDPSLTYPHPSREEHHSVQLSERPRHLALLSDSLVAVTTEVKKILLLSISDSGIILNKVITTKEKYCGIARGLNDSLVVCFHGTSITSWADQRKAGIDIIDSTGYVLKKLHRFGKDFGSEPHCLSVFQDKVIVCDLVKPNIAEVNLHYGEAVCSCLPTKPSNIAVDKSGNIYIGTESGVQVKQRNGTLRKLIQAPEGFHCSTAKALCITKYGILVAWKVGSRSDSVVIGYQLSGF